MKKLIALLGFSLCCLATSAQPTSFGGITPGKTTRAELQSLVKKPDEIGSKDSFGGTALKQPAGVLISGNFEYDVLYEITVSFFDSPELKQALIEKYGSPTNKVGGIRMVTCGNKFGASFQRLDGSEELRWPVKDGVQGLLSRSAGNCGEYVFEHYVLRHVATAKVRKGAEAEKERMDTEEKRRKLGNAY